MPASPAPLTIEQQRLINILATAHKTLLLARKLKVTERAKRVAAVKAEYEAALASIDIDLENEIAAHEDAENEALIACYDGSVPVRRMAQDGFGNTMDGAVHAKLRALRLDGRVGNKVGYQRKAVDEPVEVEFPETVDVAGTLAEALTVNDPLFEKSPWKVSLVPGDPEYDVDAVILTLDIRDPYRKRIEGNARPGTPNLHALTATLYVHPASQTLMTVESQEEGDIIWDHPVARWVKDHPDEALAGYQSALSA